MVGCVDRAECRQRGGHPSDSRHNIVGDVQANGSIDLEDLSPYVAAAILQGPATTTDHYVPMTLTSGISYTTPTGHGTYLDIIWKDWRPMTEAVARFSDGTLLLPLSGVVDNNDMDVVLKATVTVRGGAEFALPRATLNNGFQYAQTRIRVGGGYDPTPLGSQGSDSALLDTDRVMASLGPSVETADPLQLLAAPFSLIHLVNSTATYPGFLPHETEISKAGFPVDSTAFPIGGIGWVVGGQWHFEY